MHLLEHRFLSKVLKNVLTNIVIIQKPEIKQIVHEVAETIKHDVDELKEFHNDEHKTLTPRSESAVPGGAAFPGEPVVESTVYNFAHNPTRLINKENKKINGSHEYVHFQ